MRVKYTKCDICGDDVVFGEYKEFSQVLQRMCSISNNKSYVIKGRDLITGRKFKMDVCQSCMKELKKYIYTLRH